MASPASFPAFSATPARRGIIPGRLRCSPSVSTQSASALFPDTRSFVIRIPGLHPSSVRRPVVSLRLWPSCLLVRILSAARASGRRPSPGGFVALRPHLRSSPAVLPSGVCPAPPPSGPHSLARASAVSPEPCLSFLCSPTASVPHPGRGRHYLLTPLSKGSIKMALARFQKGRSAFLFSKVRLRRNICRT